MGGCNGWVFEGVKLAQANLLPMGLPHLVSQYSLSPSHGLTQSYNPTSPPAGLRPRQESSRSTVTKVRQGRMFTFLNTFQEGRAGKLKYSDQLSMFNEGKTLLIAQMNTET